MVFTDGPGGIALVWGPSGLVVYALLVSRRRSWPLLLGAALALGAAGSALAGRSAVQSLALNGAASAGSLLCAWLTIRIGGRPTLRTVRGTLALVAGAAAGHGIVSVLSHAVLSAGRMPFAEDGFWVYWAGSSLGIVLLTALLVELSEPPSTTGVRAPAALPVTGVVVGLAGGLVLLRLPWFPATGDVVLLPPLLWAALQLGQRGATAALSLGSGAYLAFGPWTGALVAGGGTNGALAVQLFIGLGGVCILLVAAVGEERRAAESRRILLERAMDHSPDGAGIVAEDGRVVWVNKALARVLGAPRSGVIGRQVWNFGTTREEWRSLWQRAAAGPVLVPAPPRSTAPAGAGEVSAVVVDVGGEQLLVAAFHDVTDRRRAEEASRLAAVGTLAAGVAHEINNPLSYVVSNLAHLEARLAGLPDPDGSLRADVLEPLAEAEDGARRVRDIVRQLGAFARAEESPGPVDPGRALRAAIAMAANEVRHRARLVTDLSATPPVIASEGRLTQVFLNLLVNAAQAIPDGGAGRHQVRAVLAVHGDEVVVEIADTGLGMSEATRARIFEPFFTTRAMGAGTGLGLAISHAIVSRMGGRIEVESTEGLGSAFRVVLPVARGVAAPSAARPSLTPPPPTLRSPAEAAVAAAFATPRDRVPEATPPAAAGTVPRLRVLVVDDEPMVARALGRLLAAHDVVTTQHGRDALARFRAGERFDAVLCDLMMPELSGMELHAAARALDPLLADRFIFITGGAFTESARTFLAGATNPTLEKPVERGALDAALSRVAQA
jgi:PAS domain S-box-containing protein